MVPLLRTPWRNGKVTSSITAGSANRSAIALNESRWATRRCRLNRTIAPEGVSAGRRSTNLAVVGDVMWNGWETMPIGWLAAAVLAARAVPDAPATSRTTEATAARNPRFTGQLLS